MTATQRRANDQAKREQQDLLVNHRQVKGRNAKHCSLYVRGDFVNRFIVGILLSIFFLYLGFFIKVYILPDAVTYVYISPIAVGPLILMYGIEMCREVSKDLENWRIRDKKFKQNMKNHDKEKEFSQHVSLRRKVNCGLIPNFLIFAAWNGGFMYLFCAKLDQVIELSIFVILIPLWLLCIYGYAFMILVGVAS